MIRCVLLGGLASSWTFVIAALLLGFAVFGSAVTAACVGLLVGAFYRAQYLSERRHHPRS